VTGEIVRDPKSKTGWTVAIAAENHGKEEATADLETDVTRQTMATGARVGPMPTSVWKKKEKVTVAAGAKVNASLRGPRRARRAHRPRHQRRGGAAEGDGEGRLQDAARTTTYAIAFRGPWADENWTHPEKLVAEQGRGVSCRWALRRRRRGPPPRSCSRRRSSASPAREAFARRRRRVVEREVALDARLLERHVLRRVETS